MKLLAMSKDEQNRAAVDPWTAVHLSAGLALGLLNAPRGPALAAAAAYEIVEQLAERREWGQDVFETAGPETLPNAIVDLVVFALGHWLGSAWNRTG